MPDSQLEQNDQTSIIQPSDQAHRLEIFANHVRQATVTSGSDEQRRMVQVLLLALVEGEINGNQAK